MRGRWTVTAPLLAVALLVTACGEALQDADFAGEPLAVLDGVVDQLYGPLTPVPDGTRLDLFWQAGDRWIQTRGPGVVARDGIAWRIVVYQAPPADALTRGWALGRVVPFRDDDGDGRRSADEPFLADPGGAAVIWTPRDLAPGEAGQTAALPAGLHRLVGVLSCAGAWPMGDEACGTRFGRPCAVSPGDGAGDGSDQGGPGPGGGGPGGGMQTCNDGQVCEVFDHDASINSRCLYPPDTCAPATGRLVPVRIGGALVARWVAACATDRDCLQSTACSRATGTCVDDNRAYRIEVATAPSAPMGCVDLEAL